MVDSKKSIIYNQLKRHLKADEIIVDQETAKVYDCDGLEAITQAPMIVTLPRTAGQVQQICRVCNQHDVPIVARGAGTGLSAGATPVEGCVVLSTARFMDIVEIDPDSRTARVGPGVRNISVSDAAKPYGLYYAPDPSSQIACTIGGNVAENSGGVHCLKYGLTVHNVLSVEMVTVEGDIIHLGNSGNVNYGPDLLALINGSEGMLGIVTEITVKLLPLPQVTRLLIAGFPTVSKAGQAVADIIAQGIIPAGLEMMDGPAIRAAEDFAKAGYPLDAEALLLCELDGVEADVEASIKRVAALFKKGGASTIKIASNEEERLLMWKGRKSAFPAVGRLSPDYYCMDGTIPRRHIAAVLDKITQFGKEYNLRVANVFHAGDGNLHPLILFDASVKGEWERAEDLGARILETCVEVGGTITGEHGVGLEKIKQMPLQFNDEELEQFHKVKRSFDPKEILNPGKAIPELKNCQEYRAIPGKRDVNKMCGHAHD